MRAARALGDLSLQIGYWMPESSRWVDGEGTELRVPSAGDSSRAARTITGERGEAVAVLVGLFGLSSSVGAIVLARRREFGVLRHLGMTRAQIGAMLAAEGGLLAVLGVAAGLVLGGAISLILIHVVNRQSFNWSMDVHVPFALLVALPVGVYSAVRPYSVFDRIANTFVDSFVQRAEQVYGRR